MKKMFPLVVKSAGIVFNKALCCALALVMLFNLSTPVFAAVNDLIKQEEEHIFTELNESLQEEYLQKSSPIQNNFELCLKDGQKLACEKFINEVDTMFTATVKDTASSKKIKEEKEEGTSPLSKKDYIKGFNESTKQEFENKTADINKIYSQKMQLLESKYQGVGINSPQYSDYILAKTSLDNWQKENLQALDMWQKTTLDNVETFYQEYIKEFDNHLVAYQHDKEAVLNRYLKTIASQVMEVYEKSPNISKLKLAEIFTYLLSMESDKVRLFTSEQKSEIYKFFSKTVVPNGNKNPCLVHTRARNSNELKEYDAWQEHLARMEQQTQKTLSARDQIAKQSRAYEERISTDLRAPITELADAQSCQAALTSLTGLAYFKGWDMTPATMFMMKNATEPMAAQVLLVGTRTLIETNRLDAFSSLVLYMIDKEAQTQEQDDLKLKEQIFYKSKFYKTPYVYSRYSQEDGGGDVWQDIAKMLAKENTAISKQIQREIVDRAVSFSLGTGSISFNHNLPFVYGVLLNNPQIIDTFIPSNAVAYSYGKYDYNGKQVYFQFDDDEADVYIKDKDKGAFYLSDNVMIRNLANNATISVGQVKKDAFAKFKEHKQNRIDEYFNYIKRNHKGLKPSAVYAEAFYKADFIDLTVEEKLAMDKALEQKYPNLKKLGKHHKYKMEKNRMRADRLSGVLLMIDVGLTLWFAADIYKGIKWGVKSLKAVRQLFTAGRTVKGLSDAKRISFLKTFAKNNPNAVKLNRNLNKIKKMPQRFINNFPKYKADFDAFMAKTADYAGAPAGMPGQRIAVQNYNKYLAKNGGAGYLGKKAQYVQFAKASGPINIVKKNGKTPVSYKEIKFNEEGFIEVDKDFLKTFKATMETDDIVKYNALLEGTIADLEKTLSLSKDRFAYLSANVAKLSAEDLLEYEQLNSKFKLLDQLKSKRYITLRYDHKKSFIEKWRSHKKSYEIVPLYDASGNIISNVSLDMSLKDSKLIYKGIQDGKKMLVKDGNFFLGQEILNIKAGAPKEVIYLMAKAGRKVEDFSFLTLTKKSSKMWPLFYNNMLSLSAGATSLNMSLNQAPFNNPDDPHYIPQPLIFGISVGFPYAFSLVSPMVAPFVKRYGATNTQTAALLIGGAGLSYATFNGYYGFASKKRDSRGRPIYDENGKTIPADKAPSYVPLVVSSLTAGLCSALTRASLNTAIHTFQTSKASMAFSMLAKNIGSLSMVLLPWGAEAFFGKDNVDFSFSYPALTGLSILGIICMKGFIPSSVAREAGYKIMPRKTTLLPKLRDFGDAGKEIFKPFVLFGSSKIMPYYLSYLSFGAMEAFVLFKTYNTFTRDSVDTIMDAKGANTSKNQNKLIASIVATLPSALVRGFRKRKTGFSQGIFNSIVLTTAGTLGLMLPSENRSTAYNISVGTLSGILIGCGTANMYQYLQKRMIAGISDVSAKGVLPLARKFDGISGLRTTAISFYSGAYIGSFIPLGYSFMAEKEIKHGASDFYANQSVLPFALSVYGWGVVPLALTQTSRAMFGKVSPYSILFSAPLGYFAIRDIYKNYYKQRPLLMPNIPYTPFNFDRDLFINPANKDLRVKQMDLDSKKISELEEETEEHDED